jgi:hypothetical protein
MLGADPLAEQLAARAGSFDLVLAPGPALDPVGDPEAAAAVVRSYAALGATGLSLRFRHRSREHYIEQLAAMARVAADVAAGG